MFRQASTVAVDGTNVRQWTVKNRFSHICDYLGTWKQSRYIFMQKKFHQAKCSGS